MTNACTQNTDRECKEEDCCLKEIPIATPSVWNFVCHVDYSKRLKDLGIETPPLFYYVRWLDYICDIRDYGIMYHRDFFDSEKGKRVIPDNCEVYNAYTSGELDLLLPECIPNEGDLQIWNYMPNRKRTWGVEYSGMDHPYFMDKNGANARAKMLIYLAEKGLLPHER